MHDVVIVGGGLAGLSAGWRLRHYDTLLLESEERIGGRIRSERRGPYWLNWGGHIFAGGDTSTSWLLHDAGIESVPVPGSLAGLAMNGRLLLKGRVETYPFRIPMSLASRAALLKAGAKVSAAVARYARVVRPRPGETAAQRQQRIYDFMDDRSFAEFVGELPEDAAALFEPTVTRSSGDMDQISAGSGVGYFSLVWNIGGGLSQSIVGGPSALTEGLAAAQRVEYGAEVHEIVHKDDSVLVRYTQDGLDHEVEARCVVLATPAHVSARIGVDLDRDVRDALSQIEYGPFVVTAFLTDESGPQVWDDAYAIATPKRSFGVVLNPSNVVHGTAPERRPGSSLMTFSTATAALRLLGRDDAEIERIHLADLDRVLPGVASHVVEAHVQRWPLASPYCFPGRAQLQPVLTRRSGRVLLAGDYLGSLYTETAIATGLSAAQDAARLLATAPQTLSPSRRQPCCTES